jgi:hypothetical protein
MTKPGQRLSIPAVSRIAGIFVFLATFLIYLRTMCEGIPFGDTAELAASAYTLGIDHPTTYPTFTLLSFLWSHLPFPGPPIYRLDLFAAFLTALSVWIFYKISFLIATKLRPGSQEVSPQHLATAVAGALAFGFASIVWNQGSSGYEVYCYQLVLFNTVLFFALRAVLRPEVERISFLLAGLFLGFCLTNHLTSFFAIPAFLVLYFGSKGFSSPSLKQFGLVTVLVLLPLPLYLYGPLRSSASFPFAGLGHPVMNEGLVGYGWANFRDALTGQGFKNFMFAPGALQAQSSAFVTALASQFAFYIGLVPALAGLVFLWKRKRTLFWFLVVMIAVTAGWAFNYGIKDIDAYFLMPVTGLMVLMVVGVVAAKPRVPWLPVAFLLLPACSLLQNFGQEDNSGQPVDDVIIKEVLANLEPNAVLFTDQWTSFTAGFFYLQHAEGLRPDVSIVIPENLATFPVYIQEGALMYPGVFDTDSAEAKQVLQDIASKASLDSASRDAIAYAHSLVVANMQRRPVYFDIQSADKTYRQFFGDLQFVPDGLSYRVLPAGTQSTVTPPVFDLGPMFDADFSNRDPDKINALQMVGESIARNAPAWQSDPAEYQVLGQLYEKLKAKGKEEGLLK